MPNMIKVKVVNNPSFKELEVKGHANSAPHGEDLVCSAVSAVVIGGLNNLANPKDFQIEIKEGYVSIKALKEIITHDEVVLETIITSLKCIEEDYPSYMKITKI